ncbi:MAG: ADP-forming succinate--CoA ligase subunit beta [Verrucomicrobia bacterium]|nr:ADP-forming succinate--CoA ligase subunit beta [Verrucomicrobiota bacterium]
MNIHEYQAKELLAKNGVVVPKGDVCSTPEDARTISAKRFAEGYKRVIIKAQVHAGGRGSGIFKSGFKGGVHFCSNPAEVYSVAKKMLGQVLVTKQTGPEGRLVRKVLVYGALTNDTESYVAVVLDRAISQPVMMVCKEGGMDIEEVAAKAPHSILTEVIDPVVGLMPYQARNLAMALGMTGPLLNPAVKLLTGVYRTWWECEATLVEINPLHIVEYVDGTQILMAVDGKINLDDNALYRHPELQELRDFDEEDAQEVEAGYYNLSYIKLDGDIACLVNGAGLAMSTMDIIKYYGGKPANFLDVGGGASPDQVLAAFKIISSDPNVKAILVNIFGGIMRCDIIANGIVAAVKEHNLNLPLVVRLEGNSVTLARQIIRDSGLNVIEARSMAEAAQKAVQAAAGAHAVAA